MVKIKILPKLLLGLSIIFAMASCNTEALYDKSYSFEKHVWTQKVKPTFVVEVMDTTKFYNVDFTLRTTTEYPFSNIWMNIAMRLPDGSQLRKPYELKITDQNGWLGTKSGTMVETILSFPKSKLPQKGKYTFTIEQATPEQTVVEVLDIGLRVSEAKKN